MGQLRGFMSSNGKGPDFAEQSSMNGNLLTADDVAGILRVPKSWVYSHLGELPTIRLGRYVRFRRSDVERFLEVGGSCQ
jgi:excisionase family DNA binding protein